MSFGAIGSGQASRLQQQPRQRRDELDSPVERNIRANIQEIQGVVRKAADVLDRRQRPSGRSAASLDRLLEEGRVVVTATEQLFREWTVQLTGEPSERQRKKFALEILQKAFKEEVAKLKEMARRAVAYQREARAAAKCLQHSHVACDPADDEHCPDNIDEEQGLLDDSMGSSWDAQAIQQRLVVEERQEGIRRIQGQVCEVNQIFRDLAAIVSEQGQHFTTIEQQAEAAAVSTKHATAELKKSVQRTRSGRDRLCCMLVASLLLLCVVLSPHMLMDKSALLRSESAERSGNFVFFLGKDALQPSPGSAGSIAGKPNANVVLSDIDRDTRHL